MERWREKVNSDGMTVNIMLEILKEDNYMGRAQLLIRMGKW